MNGAAVGAGAGRRSHLHRFAASHPFLLVLLSACLFAGCSRAEGLWRDQYVFIGDEGTVLVLGIHRHLNGTVEAKGWLGTDGVWQTNFYDTFEVEPDQVSDRSGVLREWADQGARLRVSLERAGGSAHVRIRTPNRAMDIAAEGLSVLGVAEDPEGVSRYYAGRGTLTLGERSIAGWLVAEETPSDQPRRAFVSYGDFVFVVAAHPTDGVVLVKYSSSLPSYNVSFTLDDGPGPLPATRRSELQAQLSEAELAVRLPDWTQPVPLQILDRRRSSGVSPEGATLAYETLLLRGDWSGVGFAIRPSPQDPRSSP